MLKRGANIKNYSWIEISVILYFLVLLVFGKSFTKFKVAGPLYLHDAVLLLITLAALNKGRLVFRFKSLFLLLIIAIVYLIISLLFFHLPADLILIAFRQFNLFIYLACAYFIFNAIIKTENDIHKPVHLIRFISRASVILQIIFLLYGFIFVPGFSLFGNNDYNYFSPLVIFGLITYSAMILAYEKNRLSKTVKFIIILFLSTTLGHSSAFLAVFVVLLTYFFTIITPLQRFIAIGICLAAVLLLQLLPEFRDANASWRLMYWKHVMDNLIFKRYLLLGNGFGKPYMTYDYAVYINNTIGSPIMIDELYPMARYLAPPHNSLLTIMFHVGLIPALLILVPLKPFFREIFFRPQSSDATINFLVYALTGCVVWILFNVILELPHSATYFWLVYFTAVYALKTYKR